MLTAQHSIFAQLIFYPYLTRLLKKNFSHFYFVNELPQFDNNAGLVITPNHFSWWDGFFIGHLERNFIKKKFYIMMLENQLKRFWFFQKVGAYSINPNNPKSIIETINYTSQIVQPNNVVVIYPQGKIEPFESKEITIKDGLTYFLKNVKIKFYILPTAFKIHYYDEMKPSIFVRFGKQIDGNLIKDNFQIYKDEFIENIEKLNTSANKKEFIKDIFTK